MQGAALLAAWDSGREESVEMTLYTPQEVATFLKLRVQTVYDYIHRGKLPAVRLGNRYRISRADLEAFLGQQKSGHSASPGPSGEPHLNSVGTGE
jgi:excisionase family DNA binding protein